MNATIGNITEKLRKLPKNLLESVSIYIDDLSMQNSDGEVPEWQRVIVAERIEEYKKNPSSLVDMDDVFSELDKELDDN